MVSARHPSPLPPPCVTACAMDEPLTDLFDRAMRRATIVVAFDLNEADLGRWEATQASRAHVMAYRDIPVRRHNGEESCFCHLERVIDMGLRPMWTPLSALARTQ